VTEKIRRRRFDAISVAALITGILAAAAIPALAPVRASRLADDRNAVRRYAETISPLAFEGGRVIQERVKPSLGDLVEGRTKPEDYRRLAAAWKHDLDEIRKAFASAPAPPRLTEAARFFDRAMRGYVEAIDEFARVSSTKGTADEIDAALNPGREMARRADKTYDRARRLVQAELRRTGLPESTFA
jgi:hypothetical protein